MRSFGVSSFRMDTPCCNSRYIPALPAITMMHKKHMKRLEAHIPPRGSVRALIVTERAISELYLLAGERLKDEKFLDTGDLIEL